MRLQHPPVPLAIVLRIFGLFDLLALITVVAPRSWMAAAHAFVGLGDLPDAPVVGYLVRSSSALYALHGAMILYVSFDIERYRPLIRFLGVAASIHGLVMLGIDLAVGMPWFWTLFEGPAFAATGMVVLVLLHRSRGTAPDASESR
jgi:hypothetical protein